MNYKFALAIDSILGSVQRVKFFHEHRAFWSHCEVTTDGAAYTALGYDWVKRPEKPGDAGFLKRVRDGHDIDRIEILSDRNVPEHEAFAVQTREDFLTAIMILGGHSHLCRIERHDQDGRTAVSIFQVAGFDTALQIIHRRYPLFEPNQVFRD
jgi:hypothetical protein